MEPSVQVPPVKPPFKTRLWSFVENLLYLAGAVGLALLIQTFVIRPFIVSGTSMDPIIQNGQYILIDQVTYRFTKPERGDVIVFRSPPEPQKYYVKRIVGLPGDTVTITDRVVTITNEAHPEGFILDDSFITHRSSSNYMTTVVTEGNYFVMGDNRGGSYDSRSWGLLPEENIRGRALLRLLPVSKIDYLPGKVTFLEQ